ncbi:hypothetical protein UlMin_029429 [Ulmus minor]
MLHNIKNKFRGISVDILYYCCAKAYQLCEFACLMNVLTLVQSQLGPYLQEVGYERWSMAYLEGRRYNIMTTNISECINAILMKERELPITALAEEMRSLLDPASDTVCTVLDGDKNGVVDLQARTCSNVYNFCSEYYNSSTWKATYAGVVYPLPHQDDWIVPNEFRNIKVLPSDIRSISRR